MSFTDSLDAAVSTTTGMRGSVLLSSLKGPLDAVANPITEAFAAAPPPAPGAAPPPFNPARTVQKVAGAAMAAINAPLELMNTGFALATNKIAAVFPTLPAATMGSLYVAPPHGHLHPPSFTPPATPAPIPLPSLGPVLLGTCIKVLINNMPAARAGDIGMAVTCVGFCPAFEIFMGSSKVFIGGMRAARMTDMAKACTPSIAGAVRGIAAGMAIAGQSIALAGVVADSVDATGPDPAVAAASGMAAAMGAAQMAVDAATMAITAAMGVDMAVPPSFGMVTTGMPNVQIGGFPMINFPNPAHLLFNKIKAMRAKAKAKNEGCGEEGEPIDVVTGANVDAFTDFELDGPVSLRWTRFYDSSLNRSKGPMGPGFRHQFQRQLLLDLDGFRYLDPQGKETVFDSFKGAVPPPPVAGFRLTRHQGDIYRLEESGFGTMEFQFSDPSYPAKLKRIFRGGKSVYFNYDPEGRLSGIRDSRDRTYVLSYDATGRLLRFGLWSAVEEKEYPVAAYEYDPQGRQIAWADALGRKATYGYDAADRMIRKTDRRGYSFHYRYDPAGRCVHTYGDDGLYDVRLEYYPLDRRTLATASDGGIWIYKYDENGTITEMLDPYGGKTERKVGPGGLVEAEIDPAGNVKRLLYDAAGGLIGMEGPFGERLPAPGRPVQPKAYEMADTPLAWEAGARILPGSIAAPKPEDPILASLPPGTPLEPKEFTNSAPSEPKVTRKKRDALGRLILEERQNRSLRQWAYDPNGNVIAEKTEDGSVWKWEYNSWNQLHRRLDPLDQSTTFAHSPRERITEITDPGGTKHEYEYDMKDRLVAVRRHGSVKEEYRFDDANNLIEKLDGQGRTLARYEPGPGNKIAKQIQSDGTSFEFGYDGNGRLVKASWNGHEAAVEYGPGGKRIKDIRDGKGIEHTFEKGRLAETLLLGTYKISYSPARDGALAVKDPTGARHILRFSPNGLHSRELSNGTLELMQHDWRGLCLAKLAFSKHRPGQVSRKKYGYSPEGHLLGKEDTQSGATRYSYDAAHRLIGETLPDGTFRAYQYDRAGNLLGMPGLDSVALDTGNRIAHANGKRFEFNHRNDISRIVDSHGETILTYDSQDQLVGWKSPTIEWTAAYDHLGRRISKSWQDKRVEFHWDKDRLVSEFHSDGLFRVYVYSDPEALVPFLFVDYPSPKAGPASGKRRFLFTDQIGCPVRVEDDSGETIWSAVVDPYGRMQVEREDISLSLRFPGHYYDAELGLHYNRFRYYSPELGRYIQSDPLGTKGSLNLYAYPASPLSTVDLRGLHPPKTPEGGDDPDGGKPKEEKVPGQRGPDALSQEESGYPPRTPEAESALQKVNDAMAAPHGDDPPIGKGAAPALGVVTHADGTITVGVSGHPDQVEKINARLEPRLQSLQDSGEIKGYQIAPAESTAPLVPVKDPAKPENPAVPNTTCAEPRLMEGANKHASQQAAQGNDATPNGMAVDWRKDGPNPYQDPFKPPGTKAMCPCNSCTGNAATILNHGK